ncbi:type III secretion protein [Shewanella sp. WE21]|jgi:type III secretory pathway lipoprotein EscJ|uniref:type III secretion protein n=1 Tax=Shewanella sp. WE21 TaxID=2029986 RepID=UPI000CF67803|nr:type III secretion protein [Shewanella sp. WE21]AVI67753.1 type III secretion protein [Shewanella sp. WE21]
MKNLYWIVFLVLFGCNEQGRVEVANFDSADAANKVVVLLARYQIDASLSINKDQHLVYVDKENLAQTREVLTKFNFYFEREDLNDLLESKFASLSKLETVKGNLLESREIYNKISVIPDVLRTSVVVTGEKNKRVSVIIFSFDEIDVENKLNIERFLKGLVSELDTLTVSYFFQNTANGKV